MRIYPPIEDAARADDGDNSPRMEFWKFVHPPIIRRRAGGGRAERDSARLEQ
jgi:hypothetical protein